MRCSQAFLFSMVNPHGLGPIKLPLIPGKEQNGIYCNNSKGPSFGGGCDLFISGNGNTNTDSYSNLGHSYQCPPGQQDTFFTGGTNFTDRLRGVWTAQLTTNRRERKMQVKITFSISKRLLFVNVSWDLMGRVKWLALYEIQSNLP